MLQLTLLTTDAYCFLALWNTVFHSSCFVISHAASRLSFSHNKQLLQAASTFPSVTQMPLKYNALFL